MAMAWTVKDSTGQLRSDFISVSRLELGRRIVPAHFDPFRLHVSQSYRDLFDRAVGRVLAQEGWQIVRMKGRAKSS